MKELRAFVNAGLRELEKSREEEENHHRVKIEGTLYLITVPHHLACALIIFLSLAALTNLCFIFFAYMHNPCHKYTIPHHRCPQYSHFMCMKTFYCPNFSFYTQSPLFIIISPQVHKNTAKVPYSSHPTRASSFSHYMSPPTDAVKGS